MSKSKKRPGRGSGRNYPASNPLLVLQMLNTPMKKGERAIVANPVRMAYHRMGSGDATNMDFSILGECISVCTMHVKNNNDISFLEICKEAMEAILIIDERKKRTGKYGLCHKSMKAIPEIMDLYEDIIKTYDKREVIELFRKTQSAMQSIQSKSVNGKGENK